MSITLIAAVARNGVIGVNGTLPWRLPEDLKRFKALTMGKPMIMGRKTFDSIGRALPGRRSIVVTRDSSWSAPGVQVAGSVAQALDLAGAGEVMVVGGGEIYRQLLPLADTLEITQVDADVDGETVFPVIDPTVWHEASRDEREGFAFVTYRRG